MPLLTFGKISLTRLLDPNNVCRVLYANVAEGREKLQSLFDKLKVRIVEEKVAPWGLPHRAYREEPNQ